MKKLAIVMGIVILSGCASEPQPKLSEGQKATISAASVLLDVHQKIKMQTAIQNGISQGLSK